MLLFGYTFDITDREINPSQLLNEIRASSISIVVESASKNNSDSSTTTLKIDFKSEISDEEEIVLQNLVNDHVADFTPPANMVVMGHTVSSTGDVTEGPYSGDGKLRVLASHKPIINGRETWNYFTSAGDVVASGIVGNGERMQVICTSGTPVSETDFEFLNNAWPSEFVYIFGGAIAWEGPKRGDCFNLEVRAKPTPMLDAVTGSGMGLSADYNLDEDRIYFAGPGSGTHALAGLPIMVQNFKHNGYWDLDKVNMVPFPNTSMTGDFDWHTSDVKVGNFISDLLVQGNNYTPAIIDATESAPVPFGYYFRLRCHNNSDSDWSLWGFLRMYRERLK